MNEGDEFGMKVPCELVFNEQHRFIDCKNYDEKRIHCGFLFRLIRSIHYRPSSAVDVQLIKFRWQTSIIKSSCVMTSDVRFKQTGVAYNFADVYRLAC